MHRKFLSFLALLLMLVCQLPALAVDPGPGYDPWFIRFGGGSYRPTPTSGTLNGEYWIDGPWATTGTITCNQCRLHFGSSVTVSHAITVNTEFEGGKGGVVSVSQSSTGSGLAPGQRAERDPGSGLFGSGGGGGHGGKGGQGAQPSTGFGGAPNSGTYTIEEILCGSSGGGGSGNAAAGGNGGAGGGGLYIEATGPIVIGANISANGGNGVAMTGTNQASGGGGSGGGIDIRSLNTITINSGVTISANGGSCGNGSTASGSGGGGGGGVVRVAGSSVTNNGTVQALGGTAGTGGSVVGQAGDAGVVQVVNETYGPRTAH